MKTDGDLYTQVMDDYLKPLTDQLDAEGIDYCFMDEGASAHRSAVATRWKAANLRGIRHGFVAQKGRLIKSYLSA